MIAAGHDFTVIIPLYNRASLISETLNSVLRQTLPAAQVIVVDDGSTDGSPEVVERFRGAVRLIRNGKQGVQAARNAGIEAARTEWLALCDSDDLWEPTWLERVAALRKADAQIDFVFGNFRTLRDGALSERTKFDDAPAGYWDEAAPVRMAEGWSFRRSLAGPSLGWHPMFPSAMTFSKYLLGRTGMFDAKLKGRRNEDGEFTLRLLYYARTGAIPQPLVQIRKHRDSVSADSLQLLIDEIWSLEFVKQHHSEARAFHASIDREIVARTIQAAHHAFATQNHPMVRRLVDSIAFNKRPYKLLLKRWITSLPEAIALPANDLLQKIMDPKRDWNRKGACAARRYERK
jgi:glycosyltransferase involved in cell wall biosynthesis